MKALQKLVAAIGVLFVIMILTGGYIFHIEPFQITVEYVEIETQKKIPEDGVRVVQFSDTHLKDGYAIAQLGRIVKKINGLKPDIVLFTGDLVDQMAAFGDRDEIAPVLAKIEAPVGKFAIWGNHDYGGGGVRYYEEIIEASGFTLLTNEGVVITLPDETTIEIAGLDDALFATPDTEIARASNANEDFGILMTHEPDVADRIAENGFDLIASGHSHGGQIWLPGYGPLIKTILAEKYSRGLYVLKGESQLYVNPGLGTTKVQARWFNPPEITVFKILEKN